MFRKNYRLKNEEENTNWKNKLKNVMFICSVILFMICLIILFIITFYQTLDLIVNFTNIDRMIGQTTDSTQLKVLNEQKTAYMIQLTKNVCESILEIIGFVFCINFIDTKTQTNRY